MLTTQSLPTLARPPPLLFRLHHFLTYMNPSHSVEAHNRHSNQQEHKATLTFPLASCKLKLGEKKISRRGNFLCWLWKYAFCVPCARSALGTETRDTPKESTPPLPFPWWFYNWVHAVGGRVGSRLLICMGARRARGFVHSVEASCCSLGWVVFLSCRGFWYLYWI